MCVIAEPINGGSRGGGAPYNSALLWSLVSPRDLTKSPYRFATRSTGASGEHWGERDRTPQCSLTVYGASLQSREEVADRHMIMVISIVLSTCENEE